MLARTSRGKPERGHRDAGRRAQAIPEPPFPRQHQRKPGNEAALRLAPLYDAPHYLGFRQAEAPRGPDHRCAIPASAAPWRCCSRARAPTSCWRYLSEHEDAEITAKPCSRRDAAASCWRGDISKKAFCERLVKRTIAKFGRLDVLVNNAAFQLHATRLEDLPPAQFERTLQTNLHGMYNLTRAALPHMKPGGSIINTGSVTGLHGSKHLLDYSMTKGAIHAWTRSLAGQLDRAAASASMRWHRARYGHH